MDRIFKPFILLWGVFALLKKWLTTSGTQKPKEPDTPGQMDYAMVTQPYDQPDLTEASQPYNQPDLTEASQPNNQPGRRKTTTMAIIAEYEIDPWELPPEKNPWDL